MIMVAKAPADFGDWELLMKLLHAAFAFQHDRIDPASSLHRFDPVSIAQKARDETLFLATDNGELVGCLFARLQRDSVYVGKLAVWPERQGHGIGRKLMQAAEEFARQSGRPALELETRIELTENHRTFSALGFVKTAETAHAGYDRPTAITMQKRLG